ncbi:uncharacterized protein EI97DRAFT_499560 [Westerdykella ornata]|uniref:Uncharacterized protein n=1 Tax=Westerdykella ornata TaxID=318751 RepID=A0A6A6JTI9_WESOR|nr:uncharacterized protein EI97DRAFT_499560 [Westerdykella ornata]KAF2279066.1 hypothetical protein EI97DRAFT_499560 [Westerdykella ornata]
MPIEQSKSSSQILPAVVPRDPATVKGKGHPKKQKMSAPTHQPSALTDSQREPSSFEVVAASQVTATQHPRISYTPGHGRGGDGGQSSVALTANSTAKSNHGSTASQPIEIDGSAPGAPGVQRGVCKEEQHGFRWQKEAWKTCWLER